MTPDSPYKGLNAFEDSDLDALLFFGREREREIVVANLIASRLTVLYGPSGVGKSSLLRAAVARSLRELPEEPLVIVFSRWSDDPAKPLEEAGAAQPDRDVYVILDQAEEYFLYHDDDEGPGSFAEALPAMLSSPSRVNVLISLREDSLAKLDRFIGRVPGPVREHASARPAGPGRGAGGDRATASSASPSSPASRSASSRASSSACSARWERGRSRRRSDGLGAVEGEGGDEQARIEAPYLQLVMQRVGRRSETRAPSVLRAETLERLGGAGHVVEEHLEGAMAELSAGQKDVAARLFNHLVTPSGTKIAHEVSDLARLRPGPGGRAAPVLSTLADRRILRSLEEGGAVRYEIFHDVLAQPVLAWRARSRTERDVERQLAERHRRRSRLQRFSRWARRRSRSWPSWRAFALVQRANADEQARVAEARGLDAAAIRQLEEDPELSLLLASESARSSPAPTAEDALRRSLLTSHVRDVYETEGPISDVEFSPDGDRLAFASEDGWARLVEAATGEETVKLEIGTRGRYLIRFPGRARQRRPAAGARPCDGAVLCTIGSQTVADAAMAGDFAVVARNGIGYVWETSTCELLHTIGPVGRTAVSVVASANGRRAAFVSGREARVVDVESGRVLFRLEHPGEITSLEFSAEGRRILTGGRDRLARFWNGFNGKLIHELAGHQGQVLGVAIGPGGTEIATASTDGTARIWDSATGLLRAPLFGHDELRPHRRLQPRRPDGGHSKRRRHGPRPGR